MRSLLIFLVLHLCANAKEPILQKALERPNIVIILTDDQGYGDVSCYDNPGDIRTPNIDRLAKAGVKLTSGYSTGTICAPSRAGLMAGRYQARFGVMHNRDIFNEGFVQQTTLPQVLKDSGYVTGMVGKWHLGRTEEKCWPNNRGFDEFYGFLPAMRTYFTVGVVKNPLYRNTEPLPEPEEYLTDVFNREAVAFIDRHAAKEKPFMLYLSYNAPHYPLQAKEEDIKLFNTGDKKRDIYLAMMKTVDEGVGMVLDKLKSEGVAENTLIFFLSDNGGEPHFSGHNGKLRGHKGTMFEGGHRVPFIVSWSKQVPAGKTCDVPVMSFDIFATSVAAAGGKMPTDREYDSRDIMPILKGDQTEPPRPTLHWAPGGQNSFAIRHHDWKLVSENKKVFTPMLFDLSKDIGETTDLSSKHPDKVKELTALHRTWQEKMTRETIALLGEDSKDPGK